MDVFRWKNVFSGKRSIGVKEKCVNEKAGKKKNYRPICISESCQSRTVRLADQAFFVSRVLSSIPYLESD